MADELSETPSFVTPPRKTAFTGKWRSPSTAIEANGVLQSAMSPAQVPVTFTYQGRNHSVQRESHIQPNLQTQVAVLKLYLQQRPKINKKEVNQIFGWDQRKQEEEKQSGKWLKDLSSRVQAHLRHSHRYTKQDPTNPSTLLARTGSNIRDASQMARQGRTSSRLEAVGLRGQENFQQGRYQGDMRSGRWSQPNYQEGTDTKEEELKNLERMQALKKYFTLYINTIVEENDDKLAATQKYVKTLESRMQHLGTLQKKIDHLQFEKQVKLQASARKHKNRSIAGPNLPGEDEEVLDVNQQFKPRNGVQTTKYFTNQPKMQKIANRQLQQEFIVLRNDNEALREQLQTLKQKYERQIESHIRDNCNQQELLEALEKAETQNLSLRQQLRQRRITTTN